MKLLSARVAGLLVGVLASMPSLADAVPPTEAAEELLATPTTVDRVGRILAPVEINGRGPYRFILDTGANRSAISGSLAVQLGLASDAASVEVHGVTGFATMPTIKVARMRAGEIWISDQVLPVLGDPVFADAHGILGVDQMQRARIEVDFRRNRVSIRSAGGRRAPRGYLAVPAQPQRGGLLLVNGKVGSVDAKVVIDTGAERTIGNLALQRALDRTRRDVAGSDAIVTGATPGGVSGVAVMAPGVTIGQAKLRNLAITFADLHVFDIWDLGNEPALVVGMDVLGTLESFVVDYRRNEFQLKPWGRDGATVEMCNSTGGCGTRLRTPR